MSNYAIEVITHPTEEPVTLAEAKQHARVDAVEDDALITGYVTAARTWAEGFTRRAFVTQTLRVVLPEFPAGCEPVIRLPLSKVQSVSSVKYVDAAGVLQTLSSPADYEEHLEYEPALLAPAYGTGWPAARAVRNAVQIEFIAGYGAAAAVPEGIKLAMKQLVAHWYAHRESVISGTIVGDVPQTVEMLLWPFRVYRFS